MTKIVFSGLGGVGGYYGGVLADFYKDNPNIRLCFLARGEHLQKIQEHGMVVKTPQRDFTAHPYIATNSPEDIGIADYIFCCTKTYNLEENLKELAPIVGKETIIIPLLNGVDNVERIKSVYPNNNVWGGCTYIVTRKEAAGVIHKYSPNETIWFGHKSANYEQQIQLEKIFKEAGLHATATHDIDARIWKKFMLTSTGGTLTSYYDTCQGDVMQYHLDTFVALANEVLALAKAHGVQLSDDTPAQTVKDMEIMPYNSTFSMHTDFTQKHQTELETLVGYPVRAGVKFGIDTPIYNMAYESLKKRL